MTVLFDYGFRAFHVQWTVCGQLAKNDLEAFLLDDSEPFLLEDYMTFVQSIYCETVPLGSWNVKRIWSLCKQKKRKRELGTVQCGVGNDAVCLVDGT